MPPKISVLMPAYNSERFIREAIDSILNQTERDFELVVVDDGSTDNTASIVNEFKEKDERVVYLHKDNGGIVSALNFGLDNCKGEFIARMDSDDISRENRLEIQLKEFERNNNLVLCGGQVKQFGDSDRLQPMPCSDKSIRKTIPFFVPFIHPSVMYKFSGGIKNLRYDASALFAEDYDFWVRISEYGDVKNINKVILDYRVHSGQISVTKKNRQMEVHLDISRRQLSKIGLNFSDESLKKFIFPKYAIGGKLGNLINAISINSRYCIKSGFDGYLISKSLIKSVLS